MLFMFYWPFIIFVDFCVHKLYLYKIREPIIDLIATAGSLLVYYYNPNRARITMITLLIYRMFFFELTAFEIIINFLKLSMISYCVDNMAIYLYWYMIVVVVRSFLVINMYFLTGEFV